MAPQEMEGPIVSPSTFCNPEFTLPAGARVVQPGDSRLGLFYPTTATFADSEGNQYTWSTRGQRKGRYPALTSTQYQKQRPTGPMLLPIWFGYDFRDISYWVGLIFTMGCVAWVVNGHYALYPKASVGADKERAEKVAAIAALVGGTLFEIGSWLLYWESLNPEPDIYTGMVLDRPPPSKPGAAPPPPPPAPAAAAARGAPVSPTSPSAASSSSSRSRRSAVLRFFDTSWLGSTGVTGVTLQYDPSRGMLVATPNRRPEHCRPQQLLPGGGSWDLEAPLLCDGRGEDSTPWAAAAGVAGRAANGAMGPAPVVVNEAAAAAAAPGGADGSIDRPAASAAEPSGAAAAEAPLSGGCLAGQAGECSVAGQVVGVAALRPGGPLIPVVAAQSPASGRSGDTTAAAAAAAEWSRGGSSGTKQVEARSTGSTQPQEQHGAAARPEAVAGPGVKQEAAAAKGGRKWRWLGRDFKHIGFTASFLQLVGATIFWVPCIFGAPGVFPREDPHNYKVWDGAYWLLQVVGATFFILSSLLFMLEEQPSWYHIKPFSIGWNVGFWNLIGSVGFWLCGLFGFWAVPAGRYQLGGTALSTFWGSYAFLIGSYLQLLEAINKHTESLKS